MNVMLVDHVPNSSIDWYQLLFNCAPILASKKFNVNRNHKIFSNFILIFCFHHSKNRSTIGFTHFFQTK